MEKGSLQIHSENILPIIKKWLYSDRDIFVRELVSNACDALQKVKTLVERGEIKANSEDLRIDIHINKTDRTLQFVDNGIGMDAEEIKKYIAQIAFSGAEEFISKYQTNKEGDQIIGHFGLGFYSAYMVADKVEIDSLSYKEGAKPARWICDGSSEYELEEGKRTSRGTEITLFVGKDHDECLDQAHIKKILTQYCSFLPFPIYLDGQRINEKEPLWIKAPSDCTEEDYLSFYKYLYPFEEPPLFWVHLNVDYPFHLKGILYFPKLKRDYDLNKSSVKLYCNRVFVSDNCQDVIPNYLTVLRGVIDSPDIPLNVSRSYLQMDRTVRQLGGHISKKVSDSLATLYKTNREKFIKSWEDVSTIVKLGALEDEKFYDRVKELLIWKNTAGEWTTLPEYIERHQGKSQDKVYYTGDEKHAAPFIEIFRKQGIEVLCLNHPLDSYLIHFLEGKMAPVVFQRVDAEVSEHLIDKSREKSLLDAEGKTEAGKLAEFIRSQLGEEPIEVEAKSLASDEMPGFVQIDEQQRRMRDYFLKTDPQGINSPMAKLGKQKFVVNTNNPIMSSLHKLESLNPELAKELTHELYELALLSQREMNPADLNGFINRTHKVLGALVGQVIKS